jgi:hypothetical protein
MPHVYLPTIMISTANNVSIHTSETERKRSGLSSVTIFLTASEWQRMIAMQVWAVEYSVST